ncbi:MAG TPA: methyl-accepting chemotaxis protein, partial [Oligoflexus sp.]|uniref:methyl-accepting chemotaxis protein n=1 Tax=Oligoflexus sp. TaxID=1971216 RepID=UPI002D5FF119
VDLFVMEVDSVKQDFVKSEDIQKFKDSIAAYRASFQPMVDKIKAQGDATTGTRGQLEQITDSVEKILGTGVMDSRAWAHFESMVRHQSNLVTLRDKVHADKVLEAARLLSVQVAKSGAWTTSQKTTLKTLLENYSQATQALGTSYTEVKDIRATQRGLIQNLEGMMESLSTQIMTHNDTEIKDLDKLARFSAWLFLVIFVVIVFISIGSLVEFTEISRSLTNISRKVNKTALGTKKTSDSLQIAAEKVSAATTEQASAIQETVATLNQITAMVNKSVENASSSAEKASVSFHIASEGKEAVNQMRLAMQEIQNNINDMTKQVDQSNKRVESIVQIINEISSKTQVINDIVFQTKLLSFNASVEAARAGEHGKGFAVVAEEVGNLAQMSGSAAKEIGDLLARSRTDVELIIKDSKQQMDILVRKGGEKVHIGVDIANRCEEILQEVVENVNGVKKLMEEISTAAKEEAEGVSNITVAMNEIDTTTHANSDMAHETMGYAGTLSKQSSQLRTIIRDLDTLVSGARMMQKSADQHAAAKAERNPSVADVKATETETPSNVVKLSLGRKKAAKATPEDFESMPMAAGSEGDGHTNAQVDPNDPGFSKD